MLVFMFSVPALILGMIAPRVYGRFFKNGVTRGKIAKVLGAVMLGSFIIGIATAPPVESKPTEAVTETESPAEANQGATVAEQEAGTEAEPAITSKVIKVVDGDTVTVETNGVRETIRIIGINTPETVDPRKPVECFGQEASARAHELLDNQTVTLEADSTQGERDKYDRLLRYVFLSNGSDFGKQMISEGYAYEYTYSTPYKYQQDYKTSQSDAENAKRGLWADGACSDATGDSGTPQEATTAADTSSQSSNTAPATDSTANAEPTTATTTTTETPTTTAPVIPESASPTTSCSCSSNSYNCGDFSTHAEAQAVHDCCVAQVGYDIHKLDGTDNDGLACESLP
ncbi:MAG: thermonuclease family protein, partial [Patescibacteria group bacterium]|jgi:micrococcal nuclease